MSPPFPAVFVASICLASSNAWANDSAYFGSGETVVPVNNKHIRMVSEHVRIRFNDENKQWYVHATFVFQNTTDTGQAVLMGFPDHYESIPGEERKKWVIKNFRTDVDQTKVAVEHKVVSGKTNLSLDRNEDGAYVWNVRFGPEEKKTVTNTYDTGSGLSPPAFFFTYVVRTGARWNGNIKYARFDIDLSHTPYSPLFKINPAPTSILAGVYTLEFRNFRPNFDITVEGVTDEREPYVGRIFDMAGLWRLADHEGRWGSSERASAGVLDQIYARLRGEPERVGREDPGLWERLVAWYKGEQKDSSTVKLMSVHPSKTPLFQYLKTNRLDRETVAIFRNYIFATRGRVFEQDKWRSYFSRQKWYRPDPKYSDIRLTPFERDVVHILSAYGNSISNGVATGASTK